MDNSILPLVSVIITTHNRTNVACAVIDSLCKNLIYKRINWIITDDRSDEGHVDKLVQRFKDNGIEDVTVCKTVKTRFGLGASMNNGLKAAFQKSPIVLTTEDDWILEKQLNLAYYVNLINNDETISGIRLAALCHARTKKSDIYDDLLEVYSSGVLGSVFNNQVMLRHKRIYDKIGMYRENCSSDIAEQDMITKFNKYSEWNECKVLFPTFLKQRTLDDESLYFIHVGKSTQDHNYGVPKRYLWIYDEKNNSQNNNNKRNITQNNKRSNQTIVENKLKQETKPQAYVQLINKSQQNKIETHKENKHPKVVVTMTSYPKRIENCTKVLEYILKNTKTPDKVYLNLSTQEFPLKDKSLPQNLNIFVKNTSNVVINWVDGPNTKSMKKVFPILKYLDDEDIIIDIDDDLLLPEDFIESRLKDFNKYKTAISSNFNAKFMGEYKIHPVWAASLFQKKMLKGYEYAVCLYDTNNDDTIYSLLIHLNGFKVSKCSRYDVKTLLRNHIIEDKISITKNKHYKHSYHKIFKDWRDMMEKKIASDKNKDFINYYKAIYNIGDVFSDFLFDEIYDKNKLLLIKDRKIIYFIGSEIPTSGWLSKSTLCCGMGWRDSRMILDKNTVSKDNFKYTRGKISRQRVIESGVDIPKNLTIGDTGLLASTIYKPKDTRKIYDICLITHFTDAKNIRAYKQRLLSKYKINIYCVSMGDVTHDCKKLFDVISKSKLVLSSSLHGIIFSHSFNVPALYFHPDDGVKIVNSYKFQDYYSVYDNINYDFSYVKTAFNSVMTQIYNYDFIKRNNPTLKQVKDVCRNIIQALPYQECISDRGKVILSQIGLKTDKVAIVAIARKENDYINEWIKHHLDIGFDHIYVYDNSFDGEQHIENVLKDEYKTNVTIVPAYNKTAYQKEAYNDAYHKYGDLYDYMLFIDIDEFIFLNKHHSIQSYINQFKYTGFESIRIHWDIYDDNDIIERDITRPITKDFTRKGTTQKCKEHNLSTKCLLKTKIKDMYFPNVHFGMSKSRILNTINGNGNVIDGRSAQMIKQRAIDYIKINHYVTKSISEYMNQKLKRGDADGFIVRDIENRFFIYCPKTQKKLDYYALHTSNSYVMQNNDMKTLFTSSSGGIIPLIIKHIVNQGGKCYGVQFNETFEKLEYVQINEQNMEKVTGSKYIDVTVDEITYSRIENDLKSNITVLFIGRPCQVYGVKNRFKGYDNLICIEISCFGVPEDNIWIEYIDSLKQKNGNIKNILFRDKVNGWRKYNITIEFENGVRISENHIDNEFMKSYLSKKHLKEKCTSCKFHNTIDTKADIQCGDAWGLEVLYKDNNQGTSIVIAYTKNGNNIIENIRKQTLCRKINQTELLTLKKFNNGLRIFNIV